MSSLPPDASSHKEDIKNTSSPGSPIPATVSSLPPAAHFHKEDIQNNPSPHSAFQMFQQLLEGFGEGTDAEHNASKASSLVSTGRNNLKVWSRCNLGAGTGQGEEQGWQEQDRACRAGQGARQRQRRPSSAFTPAGLARVLQTVCDISRAAERPR